MTAIHRRARAARSPPLVSSAETSLSGRTPVSVVVTGVSLGLDADVSEVGRTGFYVTEAATVVCWGGPQRGPCVEPRRYDEGHPPDGPGSPGRRWDDVSEAPDTMRSRRVVVVSSRLWQGYNDLWDAAETKVAALAVVGAKARPEHAEVDPPGTRTALHSLDLGRGLVWEHLVGLRRFLRSFRADLVHVNRELWTVVAQEALSSDAAVVVHGA